MFGKFLRLAVWASFSHFMISTANATTVELSDAYRADTDELQYQRSAIGKLTNETGAWCSGVAISNDRILTAAHCLFNRRTGRFIAAESLHFLLGYHVGQYAAHVRIASYEIGPGFDPLRYGETVEADWALLKVAEPIPHTITPIRLSSLPSPAGTKAAIIGYSQHRAHAQTTGRECELREDIIEGKLMLHTCDAQKGFSGAPILVRVGGEIRIAGIQIATIRSEETKKMLAIPAQAIEGQDRTRALALAAAPAEAQEAGTACFKDDNVALRMDDIHRQFGLPVIAAKRLDGLEETASEPALPGLLGVQ